MTYNSLLVIVIPIDQLATRKSLLPFHISNTKKSFIFFLIFLIHPDYGILL
jgi:hypothetical protein